jgi:hypothetical protein
MFSNKGPSFCVTAVKLAATAIRVSPAETPAVTTKDETAMVKNFIGITRFKPGNRSFLHLEGPVIRFTIIV